MEAPVESPFSDLGATPAYSIEEPLIQTEISVDGIPLLTVSGPSDSAEGQVIDMAMDGDREGLEEELTTQDLSSCKTVVPEVVTIQRTSLESPSDSVVEFTPHKTSIVPAGAPAYRLIPLERKSKDGHLYDQWHQDPRLFYLAAPSTYKDEYPSRMLHEARRQAMYEPGRRVAKTILYGTSHIERMESVELKDGRVYRLSARWFADSRASSQVAQSVQCCLSEG